MDWSKAKNILIVAFIITNLILTYVLIENRPMEDTFNDEFITNVKEKLSEKDIKLSDKVEIPIETPSLPKLTIEYDIYKAPKIAEAFFDKYSQTVLSNAHIFRAENETLAVKNNKELIYTNRNYKNKYEDLSEKGLKKIVQEFLTDKGFATDDYKLADYDYITEKKIHQLKYVKVYKDKYVEKTYMKFQIDKSGVIKFERFWVDVKDRTENKILVSSAPNALLRLLSKKEVTGKTITDISLCYYFDPNRESEKHEEMFDPDSTSTAQATPVWRIKFSDGSTSFIEEQ